MGIAVLGPLQVGGQTNGLSPRDRVVLSTLVVRAGDPVSTGAIADALWGDSPPPTWTKVIQGSVVRLRKRLGTAAIESGPSGYRLVLHEDELDHLSFERLLERGREALAGDDPERASYLVREALELWRGGALPDLEEWEPGRVEAARLDGLRQDAEELLVEAEIAAGRAPAVLERARALVARAPLRERRWVLLATALYQAGRQAEALGAVHRARSMLAAELGLDPGHELLLLEQQLLRHDATLTPATEHEVSAVCPYRGLLAYDAEHADAFFGREDDVAACLRRLRDARVLTVVGPSGVGKSSLVRAGVVSSLARAGTPVLVTTPGAHPMDSLSGLKARGRQTLVVDQAEEAVTVCADPAERERYFAALAAHVGAGGALVLALRADHLGDLAPYPAIARVLEDGLYLLGPMNEPDLRRAIEVPARQAGLRLEPGLVDLLVREVEGEPAGLPMLSHVLRETWERREGATLTVEGYRSTGGIRHAVSQSAESLYDAVDESERSRLRSLLLRLVMPTEDGDPVRARVPRAQVSVDAVHVRLVERLVDARLVSIDGDTVQIAHEALIRVWPRLRSWLDDDVDGLRTFRHLAGAADAWDQMGRPDSELYRGARLSRTLEWQERAQPDLNDTERAFLDASAALWQAEARATQVQIAHERSVNRRLRGALVMSGVLLVLALIAGMVAVRTADQARTERDRARAAADLADARRAGEEALTTDDPAISLLLAASALQVDRSPEAWGHLADALMRNPSLVAVRDPGNTVVDLATSPVGSLLAASRPGTGAPSEGEGLRLLDADALEPLPFEEEEPASGIAFSPDGKVLAMALNQWNGDSPPHLNPQPVRLYDMPGGTLAARQLGGFSEGSAVEYSLDFSQDGSRFTAEVQHYHSDTGRWDETSDVTVWNVDHPARPVFTVTVPDYPVLNLSPDGRRLYVALTGDDLDRPIRVYDVDSGRLLASARSKVLDEIGAFAGDLSPDGSTLAVATASKVIRYDTATLKPRGPDLRGPTGDYLDKLEYSHDGSMLAAVTREGGLVVWDTDTGQRLRSLSEPTASSAIAFSADDRTLFSSGGALRAWDLSGRRELFSVGRSSDTAEYAVSKPGPDGHTLVRERLGRLWFVDNRTGRTTPKTPKQTHDWSHVWSSDGRWLLTSREGGMLRLWDTATARLVGERRLGIGGFVTSFSLSGDEVYVSNIEDAELEVLDRATMKPKREPIQLGRGVLELLPDPNSTSLYGVAGDGAVLRINPGTGQFVRAAPPGTLSADSQSVALSPDGTRMAATISETRVQLLDTATWQRVGTASEWEGGNIYFAPDGSQFASVVHGRITLHDGRTGAVRATIPLPASTPDAWMSYLPNSRGMIVAAVDGTTWTVDTRTRSWLDRACRIAGRNLSRREWKKFFPNRSYEVTCSEWPSAK
jgi:DNA-binding SARP family transcriptional activator/WD40 repeat protein